MYRSSSEIADAIEISAEHAGELAKALACSIPELGNMMRPDILSWSSSPEGLTIDTGEFRWLLRAPSADCINLLCAMIRPEFFDASRDNWQHPAGTC